MPPGLGLGLGLHLGSAQGGVGEVYINPDIPAVANIVRAWSLRRLIPAYALLPAVLIERTDDGGVGVPDSPNTPINFEPSGRVTVPAGADAWICSIFDQVSGSSPLFTTIFNNCPQIYNTGVQHIAPLYIGSDLLATGAAGVVDSAVSTAVSDVASGWTFSFWIKLVNVDGAIVPFTFGSVGGGNNSLRFGGVSNGKHDVLWVINSSTLGYMLPTGSGITTNAWHNIAIKGYMDGTTAKKAAYVNGSLIAATVSELGAPVDAQNPLSVSAGFKTMSTNDIVFYSKALSDAEVTALYNATKGYYE